MSDFIAKGNVLNFFQKCVTKNVKIAVTEAPFTCSKLTIETLMWLPTEKALKLFVWNQTKTAKLQLKSRDITKKRVSYFKYCNFFN